MTQEPNIYEVYEKIGHTLNAVDKLDSEFRRSESEQNKRHEENVKRFEDIFKKLTEFKHEQLGNEQKLMFEIHNTKRELRLLRKPVDDIIALRSKIGMFMAAIFSIGGCVWFFLQPIWTFVSERVIGHVMSGGQR
jgi:hypothetical protein